MATVKGNRFERRVSSARVRRSSSSAGRIVCVAVVFLCLRDQLVHATESASTHFDQRTSRARATPPADSIAGCPATCTCRAASSLHCTIAAEPDFCRLFSSFPVDGSDLRLTMQTQFANCSSRRASFDCDRLPGVAEKPIRIEHLDLSDNDIADSLWFRNYPLFRRLRSSSLVSVNAAANRLEVLKNGTFDEASFAAIETLDLSNNVIRRLDARCFVGLSRLRTLVLAGNEIDRLDTGSLDGLQSLVTLNLDRNRLTSVDVDAILSTLGRLDVLTVAGNKIEAINASSWQDPTAKDKYSSRQHLDRLDLSDNRLEDWPFMTTIADVAGSDDDYSDVYISGAGIEPLDIRVLILDGNPIRKLLSSAGGSTAQPNRKLIPFVGAVDDLSISRMPELIAFDLSVFGRLVTSPEMLAVLSVHDNGRLRYIGRRNKDALKSLRHLYLHNNNLTTVSEAVVSGLNSLSLYGNPLGCGCHLRWFVASGSFVSYNSPVSPVNRTLLLKPNDTLCASPNDLTGIPVLQSTVYASKATDRCGPAVIPLFDATTVLPLGADLVLDCRVLLGFDDASDQRRSTGEVVWTTPDIVDHSKRLEVDRRHVQSGADDVGSTLIIRRLRSRDAGVYRCRWAEPLDDLSGNVSSSSSFIDQGQTVLRLYNMAAGVFPVSIGQRSVTVVWNGTDSTLTTTDYVVVYRPMTAPETGSNGSRGAGEPCVDKLSVVNDLTPSPGGYDGQRVRNVRRCDAAPDAGAILIRPFLRKYTISRLRPNAVYEFCMTARSSTERRIPGSTRPSTYTNVADDGGLIRIRCVNITTRLEFDDVNGFTRLGWFPVMLLAAAVASGVAALACAVCAGVRRYRFRKWYGEPEMTTAVSCDGESVGVRLTAGLRRGPTAVATYGLPLNELRSVGRMTTEANKYRSVECMIDNSPLSTSRTSLVGAACSS